MEETAWVVVGVFNYIVLIYFFLLNGTYLGSTLLAFGALQRYARRLKALDVEELIQGAGAPPISLLAPAYNEEATCVQATKALLTLNYPEYEILVINDGSKDATLARLTEAFDLSPASRPPTAELHTKTVRGIYRSRRNTALWIIDKENGGKADALNTGINYCQTPLFCAIDADSIIERDALIRIVRPFLEDNRTVAAGGIIRIVNGCSVRAGMVTDVRLPDNTLARFQVLEYLRAFLAGRMGWDVIQATLIISGAFGLFKRGVVVEAGGYREKTVGEDMELVVRLHRHCLEKRIPYRVAFVPDPVAWTECPETIKILGRQRDRWQRGLAECLGYHMKMLLNPRYGRIGLLAFPYFFFLELLGPAIELGGYLSFLFVLIFGSPQTLHILAFLAVTILFGIALSIASVGLEELCFRRYPRFSDLLRLFWLAVLENFGYRQLQSYWRIKGLFSLLRRRKGWGKMERKGFTVAPKP